MALDTIIIDGDLAKFEAAMGEATVVPAPGIMKASGKTTIKGKAVCLDGDETKVIVTPCVYTTKSHPVPGMGIYKISALGVDQLSTKSKSGNKAFILMGSKFEAVFEVLVPAQDLSKVPTGGPPVLDFGPHEGKGEFEPANSKIKAT